MFCSDYAKTEGLFGRSVPFLLAALLFALPSSGEETAVRLETSDPPLVLDEGEGQVPPRSSAEAVRPDGSGKNSGVEKSSAALVFPAVPGAGGARSRLHGRVMGGGSSSQEIPPGRPQPEWGTLRDYYPSVRTKTGVLVAAGTAGRPRPASLVEIVGVPPRLPALRSFDRVTRDPDGKWLSAECYDLKTVTLTRRSDGKRGEVRMWVWTGTKDEKGRLQPFSQVTWAGSTVPASWLRWNLPGEDEYPTKDPARTFSVKVPGEGIPFLLDEVYREMYGVESWYTQGKSRRFWGVLAGAPSCVADIWWEGGGTDRCGKGDQRFSFRYSEQAWDSDGDPQWAGHNRGEMCAMPDGGNWPCGFWDPGGRMTLSIYDIQHALARNTSSEWRLWQTGPERYERVALSAEAR